MTTKELILILHSLDCDKCPNKAECFTLDEDECMLFDQAADRLEELVAELEDERYRHDRYVDFELAEAAELAKVMKERDAMLADLTIQHNCNSCRHNDTDYECCLINECKICEHQCPCYGCLYGDKWEWRGFHTETDNR